MRNREAETPVIPSSAEIIVVDIASTTIVRVADNQAVTASHHKNVSKTHVNRRPHRLLTAIILLSRVVHFTFRANQRLAFLSQTGFNSPFEK